MATEEHTVAVHPLPTNVHTRTHSPPLSCSPCAATYYTPPFPLILHELSLSVLRCANCASSDLYVFLRLEKERPLSASRLKRGASSERTLYHRFLSFNIPLLALNLLPCETIPLASQAIHIVHTRVQRHVATMRSEHK